MSTPPIASITWSRRRLSWLRTFGWKVELRFIYSSPQPISEPMAFYFQAPGQAEEYASYLLDRHRVAPA